MSTLLNLGRDVQGYNAYAPVTAKNKWNATLVANAETNITVPSNFQTWIVVFSFQPGADVWVDLTGSTAAIPSGSTLATCTAELLPAARTVQAGTEISMITANATADVGVMLYAVSYP